MEKILFDLQRFEKLNEKDKRNLMFFSKMNKKGKDRFALYLIDEIYESYFDYDGNYLLEERLKLDPCVLKTILPYLLNKRIDERLNCYESRRCETAKSIFHILDLSSVAMVTDDKEKHVIYFHGEKKYIHRVWVSFDDKTEMKQYMLKEDIKRLEEEITQSSKPLGKGKSYVKKM